MKIFITIYFIFCCNFLFAQSGTLKISVIEKTTWNKISNAKISMFKDGKLLNESITDSLGHVIIPIANNDTIDISCEALFYKKSEKKNINLKKDKITFIDFSLEKM